MKISRRDFLKSSAIAAAALGSTPVFAEEKVAKSVPNASGFGAFYTDLDESGKIIKIRPQESDKDPKYPLNDAWIERVYSDTRVKFPCVRKSYLEGKDKRELRGKEEFVRVSWDKAYELIVNKLKSVKSNEIFNAAYDGWSHPGLLHNCVSLPGRFFNTVFGGSVITDGDYSTGAASRVNGDIIGDLEVYSLQSSHKTILENTKVYVLWGADIFKCNQVDYKVANRANNEIYDEYVKAGIKFITIEPQYTPIAKKFNAQWIKIRPNTDVALMLGMMHYLYTSKKYDKEFIAKYTDGFDKFVPYLLGKTMDKIEKTPNWASKITGVDEEAIKSLADTLVSNRSFIAGSWSIQRAHHGEQAQWALIVLASMIGQIGLVGGGLGLSMHYSGNGQAACDVKLPAGLPQGKNEVEEVIPASRISEAILNPGKEIKFKGEKIKYPKIKVLYATGANVLGHHPNANEMIKALRTLDTVISQDPWWTPTSKYADIVLPAATQLERDDITYGGSFSQDYLYAMKKVIEPLYESKCDYDIFADMAKMVSDKAFRKFSSGKDKFEHIKKLYERSDCPDHMSFDEFWEKGFMKFEPSEEAKNFTRHADFRADPVKNRLATKSGKIQIFCQKFADYKLDDFKGHPVWIEPAEWLGNKKLTAKFPFHFLSPHPLYRIHSQADNSNFIRKIYKVGNREPITINDEDAATLGIKDGDTVEVFNSRGKILAGAVVTKNIMRGVVALQEGAWVDLDENGVCQAGNANILTSSIPTSSMAQATSVDTCLVGIRKSDAGEYKGIKPPKIIEA